MMAGFSQAINLSQVCFDRLQSRGLLESFNEAFPGAYYC